MNRTHKLMRNTLIFSIGSFGSKLITFFIVPIYTFYMLPEEYGHADLLMSIISMVLPVISLSIYDAVLRFGLEKQYESKVILSTTTFFIFGMTSSFFCITILINLFFDIQYLFFLTILLVIQIFYNMYSQYLKSIEENLKFSLASIVLSLSLLIFSYYFLKEFNNKINAFFISQILSYVFAVLYLILTGKLFKLINIEYFDIRLLKEMIRYSGPLVPNQIMWWIMNASNRFFITLFLGVTTNGIYAVASKIPALLSMLSSIFIQSWQVSAIEENGGSNRSTDQFYSIVFNNMVVAMLLTISFLISILKPLLAIIVGNQFFTAWEFVPFLLLSLFFSVLSQFVGMNYLVSMKTGGIFKTSLVGGVLNLILNLFLIKSIGANGASLGSCISFFVVWIIRLVDTKSTVKIDIDWKVMVYGLVFIVFQILILYSDNSEYNIVFLLVIFFISKKYWLHWFLNIKMLLKKR